MSGAAVWLGVTPGKNVSSVTNMILSVLGGMCEGGLSVCTCAGLSMFEVGTSA